MDNNGLDLRNNEPLYEQLINILMNEITSNGYKPDDRFMTEREIEEKYKTSRTTIKIALNELVHKNLLYRRPRKGTFVKSNKILNNGLDVNEAYSRNLIMVLPKSVNNVTLNPFYSLIVEGIENECVKSGYRFEFFILDSTEHKTKALFSKLNKGMVKGMFLISGATIDENFVLKMRNKGIPIIFIPFSMKQQQVSSVVIDDVEGAFRAVEYLIENGHRDIAFLGSRSGDLVSNLRLEGYKKAMRHYKIPINDKFIIKGESMDFQSGYNSMKKLLKMKKLPTALFAVNDSNAIGAMKEMAGSDLKIPDDISIIGFDDIEMASHIQPPLTTMRVDRQGMGNAAAKLMFEQLNGNTESQEKVFIPELIERETVRKL